MFYFFLCDRTNFFMKENKYFTQPNFFLPIAYVFALGLFFTEESSHTIVLHRDQTDELKGWMQMIILGIIECLFHSILTNCVETVESLSLHRRLTSAHYLYAHPFVGHYISISEWFRTLHIFLADGRRHFSSLVEGLH